MSEELPSQQTQAALRWAERIEGYSKSFSDILYTLTQAFAYFCVLAGWFVFGLIAYVVTLAMGIPIVLILILLTLLAGFRVDAISRRFFDVLKFYPEGFIFLTQAFWTQPRSMPIGAPDRQPSYVFGTLKALYVVVVIYFMLCLYWETNPISYLILVPQYIQVGVGGLFVISLLFMWYCDWRNQAAPHVAASDVAPQTAADASTS